MRTLATMTVAMLLIPSSMGTAGAVFVGALRSRGVVLANSVPMPDGGTVRTGDSVQTQPGALALVTSPSHGRLEIRSDSEARLGGDRVTLERGAVAASQLAVETGGYLIRPQATAPAWFAVANRDGRLVIAAHRGNVVISSAGAPAVVLNEGSAAQQDKEQQQDPPKKKQKGKKKKRAGAAATSGGWTIGSLSHAASVALVVGVGAATTATVAGFAVSLNDEGPSPSR